MPADTERPVGSLQRRSGNHDSVTLTVTCVCLQGRAQGAGVQAGAHSSQAGFAACISAAPGLDLVSDGQQE